MIATYSDATIPMHERQQHILRKKINTLIKECSPDMVIVFNDNQTKIFTSSYKKALLRSVITVTDVYGW